MMQHDVYRVNTRMMAHHTTSVPCEHAYDGTPHPLGLYVYHYLVNILFFININEILKLCQYYVSSRFSGQWGRVEGAHAER